jgi:hypothetical protein
VQWFLASITGFVLLTSGSGLLPTIGVMSGGDENLDPERRGVKLPLLHELGEQLVGRDDKGSDRSSRHALCVTTAKRP